MKTFKIKNYKGDLVESLSKFQESHKDMKIVEVVEEENILKIKAESALIKEEIKDETIISNPGSRDVWVITADMMGVVDICTSLEQAKKDIEILREKYKNISYRYSFYIQQFKINTLFLHPRDWLTVKSHLNR